MECIRRERGEKVTIVTFICVNVQLLWNNYKEKQKCTTSTLFLCNNQVFMEQ